MDSYILSWQKIVFPKKKEDIEKYICERFAFHMVKVGATIYSIEQNEENNFDFTLKLPGGTVYLDLVEIIINDSRGSPYSNEQLKISYSDYIDSVLKIVSKKSLKYESKSEIPISLLIYCSHWRFIPNDEIIFILQYIIQNNNYIFENIFIYTPLDDTDGTLTLIHPTDVNKFKNITPEVIEKSRSKFYLNLNPNKFELFMF